MATVTFPFTLENGPTHVNDADEVMANLESLRSQVNGNLDASNIAAGGIGLASLAQAARGVHVVAFGHGAAQTGVTFTAQYTGEHFLVAQATAIGNVAAGLADTGYVSFLLDGSTIGSTHMLLVGDDSFGKHVLFPIFVVSLSLVAGSRTFKAGPSSFTNMDGNDSGTFAVLEAR